MKKMKKIAALAAPVCLAFLMSIPSAARAEELPSHPNRDEIKKLDESSCDDGFSFVVMGDNQGSRKVFEFLVDTVDEMKPDFAYSVGDITNDGMPDEFEMYVGQINRTDVPWFAVPGNHEYRDPGRGTSLEKQRRYRNIFGKQDFIFDHCGWRFIGLDVVAFDALLPEQLNKLEKALKGHEGRTAVFMHYPPAVIRNWEEGIWVSGAEKFMWMLDHYKVRYFFSGHIHVHDRMMIGPTTYIVTGGSGGGLDRSRTPDTLNGEFAGAFYHFMYVKVDGNLATEMIVKPYIPPDKGEDWVRNGEEMEQQAQE